MALLTTPRRLANRGHFYHELATLLQAGLPIRQALASMRGQRLSPGERKIVEATDGALEQGATFTEAFAAGAPLASFDRALIEAGERSGRLDATLFALARHYEQRATLAREMIGQSIYPGLVLHMAVLIFPVGLLANLVWKGEAGAFLAQKVTILAALYATLGAALYSLQSNRSAKWRWRIERLAERIPVWSGARHALALSRFSAALESLISAGVTVLEAWPLAASASGSMRLQRMVSGWAGDFDAGQTPGEKLRLCPYFPDAFSSLYSAGEVSGQLDQTLERLRTYYEELAGHKLRQLSQWIPRMLYGAVAVIVAWKVISFYTGYFDNMSRMMQ